MTHRRAVIFCNAVATALIAFSWMVVGADFREGDYVPAAALLLVINIFGTYFSVKNWRSIGRPRSKKSCNGWPSDA